MRIQKTEGHDRLSIQYSCNKNIPLFGTRKKWGSQSCPVKTAAQAAAKKSKSVKARIHPVRGVRQNAAHAQQAELSSWFGGCERGGAEPDPRLKDRQPIMRNNIAGLKKSCTPQKLQGILSPGESPSRHRAEGRPCGGMVGAPMPGASARSRFSRGVQAKRRGGADQAAGLKRGGSDCVLGERRFRRVILTVRCRWAAPAAAAGRQEPGMTSEYIQILP